MDGAVGVIPGGYVLVNGEFVKVMGSVGEPGGTVERQSHVVHIERGMHVNRESARVDEIDDRTAAPGGVLSGRVGLVTGAAAGIGRATAHALVAAGADVAVVDIDQAAGEETVATASGPGSATFLRADVADEESIDAVIASMLSSHGKIDFAHNNAGVATAGRPLADISRDEWDRVIAVDLTGVFLCMKAEIKAMLAAGGGAIVNTASALGTVGIRNLASYVAAKHGVVGLTRAAALEYSAAGIRVNAVCPGVVETKLFRDAAAEDPELRPTVEASHPIGRLGEPEEIAAAVVWLVSDASSFVTGQPIGVDGGYTSQ